jgi:hypothetical protein
VTELRSFRGLRFDLAKAGNPRRLVAPPPYLLTPEARRKLLQRGRFNVARLTSNPDAEGRLALLRAWLKDGVLRQDPEPSLYLYEQLFTPESERMVRRGLIGVLPVKHYPSDIDETAPAVGIYEDPDRSLDEILLAARSAFPDLAVTHADVEHRLFRIFSPHALAEIRGLMKGRSTLLLDEPSPPPGSGAGSTATPVHVKAIPLPGTSPSAQRLVCLFNQLDVDQWLRPFHRVVRGLGDFNFRTLLRQLADDFELTPIPSLRDVDGIIAQLGEAGREGLAIGVIAGAAVGRRSGSIARLRPDRKAPIIERLTVDQTAPGDLDVALLDHWVLKELMALDVERGGGEIVYLAGHDRISAMGRKKTTQVMFLLNIASSDQIRATDREMGHLPARTVYLHPAPLAGLVLRHPDG